MNKDTRNKLHFWWSIAVIVCVIVTYCYMKAKATDNYKTILRTASQNCNLEVVKFSVKDLLGISARIPQLTALHHASDSGCLEVVRFLVHEKANLNALGSNEGWTALHFAALEGHLEIISFLLENGANPNIRDNNGKTARRVAVIESRHNKDKPYGEIIKLLAKAEDQYKSEK